MIFETSEHYLSVVERVLEKIRNGQKKLHKNFKSAGPDGLWVDLSNFDPNLEFVRRLRVYGGRIINAAYAESESFYITGAAGPKMWTMDEWDRIAHIWEAYGLGKFYGIEKGTKKISTVEEGCEFLQVVLKCIIEGTVELCDLMAEVLKYIKEYNEQGMFKNTVAITMEDTLVSVLREYFEMLVAIGYVMHQAEERSVEEDIMDPADKYDIDFWNEYKNALISYKHNIMRSYNKTFRYQCTTVGFNRSIDQLISDWKGWVQQYGIE